MGKEATLDQGTKLLSIFKDTPEEQVQAILASGLLADLRDGNVAGVNRDELRRLLGLAPLTPDSPKSTTLLEVVGTIRVAATSERFFAREKFLVNTRRNAAVKISYLTDNFKEWFLGKIEEPMAEIMLRYATLLRSSRYAPILAELGNAAEVALAHVFALMECQPNGGKGVLLTNWWNVFCVGDVNGVRRAVYVRWGHDGWGVRGYSVEDPFWWGGGCQVFSRNSSAPVAV